MLQISASFEVRQASSLKPFQMLDFLAQDPNKFGTLLIEDIAHMIGETRTGLAVKVEGGVDSERAQLAVPKSVR